MAELAAAIGDLEGSRFVLATTENVRIEVFPAVSAPVECWRLFVRGSNTHDVYPPGC